MKGLLMRMACILVILTTAIVAGFAEKGSAQRVSIHRTDATLKAVIADLRAQTGYGVMIEKELLAGHRGSRSTTPMPTSARCWMH